MISYIERKQIDDVKWNACIDKAFNGNLYGYSWFLDIVGVEWDALVENDYERVFPLVFKKKFGVYYIYQPFFTQQLGLFSTIRLDPAALSLFIRAIPAKFKQAEINLNTLNKADGVEFSLVPQLNHELDLIHSYEKIRKFILQTEPFNVENGELTPKLSLRRHIIYERNKEEIEKIYKL